MYSALVERTLSELRALRRYIEFSGKLRAVKLEALHENALSAELTDLFKELPDATSWRVLDHSAAITRAYALFEGFVLNILREYLTFLARSYAFQDLGRDFVLKYTRGVGQILIDQEKSRFSKIDVGALLSQVTTALNGSATYQLQPEALLQTEQNLRMPEVQRLFGHCGLRGVSDWISRHGAMTGFFQSQSRLSDTAESELKEIVGYRNEASHGNIDEVLGQEVLIEVTEFFEAMLLGVSEFVQYDILRRSKELGVAETVAIITEQFHDDIVVAKIKNSTLRVGEPLYVFGKGMTGIALIGSIRLDDVDHDDIKIDAEREVGLTLGLRAKVGCELVRLN